MDAAAIHGDLPQAYRTQTLQNFRDGKLTLLIGSDVAARGLDIPDVSHVFNFGPPPKDEDYIHRIGRTGRAGREGTSYTLVSPADEKSWGFVLKMIKQDVEEYMPDGLIEELADLPADSGSSRGGRSGSRDKGGRSRGSRSRGRDRERSDTDVQVDKDGDTKSADAPTQDTPQESKPVSEKPRSDKPINDKPRRDRGGRKDYKRKDDDLLLEPAPDNVKGFGDDIPSFLRR